jgi:Gram-negative bacterial TonB protein C-terminal
MIRHHSFFVLALLLAVSGCQVAALRDQPAPDDAPDTVYAPGILPLAGAARFRIVNRMDPTVTWPCHGQSGATVLSYQVTENGTPANIHFVERDGSFLDDVARRKLSETRFRFPSDSDDQRATSHRYRLRITFVVQGHTQPNLPTVPFPEWVFVGNIHSCHV